MQPPGPEHRDSTFPSGDHFAVNRNNPARAKAPAVTQGISLRPARRGDVEVLFELESASFGGDRISRRSWLRLLGSESAAVGLAMQDGSVVGAVVVLYRVGSSVARVYSLAVSPIARKRGIAGRLLNYASERARHHGSAVLRLETRLDNIPAQSLFHRFGFTEFARRPGYYEDGEAAIRYQKYLWDVGHATEAAALRSPFYAQTLDFTCGPCALMMAMAALDPSTVVDRVTEIRLWREATTVFLAAGHGGCGPFGLACAAMRRGFGATVYAPSTQTLFVDSVRDPRKKEVIELVEGDFRREVAATDATVLHTRVSAQKIIEHLAAGNVPIVLISLWRMHGEKGPHWVVVTGFDGAVFRVLDPMSTSASGDPAVSVSVEDFGRISRYGRLRQTAAVILSKGK